jgi:hypothetical protein
MSVFLRWLWEVSMEEKGFGDTPFSPIYGLRKVVE